MSKTKTPITWGDKARELRSSDVCRGQARLGNKQDIRGWMTEFFGENTRAEVAFSRHFATKAGIRLAHDIELWSDDAPVVQQVKFFNETLKDLKVLTPKGRSKRYGFFKQFKNGKVAKNPKEIIEAQSEKKALDKLRSRGYNTESELSQFLCQRL